MAALICATPNLLKTFGPFRKIVAATPVAPFVRAYLRHFYRAGEITALRLGTIHNVHFMLNLMQQIRDSLAQGRFADFRSQFLACYQISNQEVRHEQLQKRRESKREKAK